MSARFELGAGSVRAGASRGRLLALLLGVLGLATGFALGCVVADPAYCERDEQCGSGTNSAGSVRRGCHPIRHICMELIAGGCFTDSDCADPERPRCDQHSTTCAPCLPDDPRDTSCSHVTATGRAQCTAMASGEARCVECSSSRECPADRPICDGATSRCRACSQHSDCEGELTCENGAPCTDSLVCIRDGDLNDLGAGHAGRCAHNAGMTGRVIYAAYDPSPMVCTTMDGSDGQSPTTPVCNLDVAIDKARGINARYVRLIGANDFDVAAKSLGAGALSIIGAPRRGGSKNIRLQARGGFLDVQPRGDLTLDQVDIAELSPTFTPLTCLGGVTATDAGRLRLFGCTISGSTQPSTPMLTGSGLRAENCSLVIDRSVFGIGRRADLTTAGAHAYGLSIYESPLRKDPLSIVVQNSLFAGNILAGIAVERLSDSTSALFQFNTLYKNGRTGSQPGGVTCPLGANTPVRRFVNNIIVDNQTDVGGSQFVLPASCTFFNNVVGSETYKPLQGDAFINLDAELDDSLRLSASDKNRDCCIDKATAAGSEVLPGFDLDGTPRPQPSGGRRDIGATEVK